MSSLLRLAFSPYILNRRWNTNQIITGPRKQITAMLSSRLSWKPTLVHSCTRAHPCKAACVDAGSQNHSQPPALTLPLENQVLISRAQGCHRTCKPYCVCQPQDLPQTNTEQLPNQLSKYRDYFHRVTDRKEQNKDREWALKVAKCKEQMRWFYITGKRGKVKEETKSSLKGLKYCRLESHFKNWCIMGSWIAQKEKNCRT